VNGGAIPSFNMFFYVYILKCSDSKLYIGYSSDLKQRMKDHKMGLVKSTRNRRPLELVYYEAYKNKKSAQERERQLKKFASSYKGLIKRIGLE
jgi:putative endonuclease